MQRQQQEQQQVMQRQQEEQQRRGSSGSGAHTIQQMGKGCTTDLPCPLRHAVEDASSIRLC
jgi:hypothetical protein